MNGVILTGPLGVGKSSLQANLVDNLGFWCPQTITTRTVSCSERWYAHVDAQEFLKNAREGKYVCPYYFAGQWYAWVAEDVFRLQVDAKWAVINVRPYTALLLGSLVRSLKPVWLWLEPEELRARLRARNATRDITAHDTGRLLLGRGRRSVRGPFPISRPER
jgi:guanylate kinase